MPWSRTDVAGPINATIAGMRPALPAALLALLTAAAGLWGAACVLNPQPEPPMDFASGNQGGAGNYDASTGAGGASGASGAVGVGGAAGAGGGGLPYDAALGDTGSQTQPDGCEGDDCKCSEDDGGDCGAPCPDAGDAADEASEDAAQDGEAGDDEDAPGPDALAAD